MCSRREKTPAVIHSSRRARQRCGRDPIIGVFGVSTAENETGDELVEDHSVGHSRSVTSEWVIIADGW